MKTRKTYDTKVKYLARKGLLPAIYKEQINRSLISKWKKESPEKYVGYELNENIEEFYEMMKLVSENQRIQKALRAFYRINKTLRDTISKTGTYITQLRENKDQVVKTIKRAGEAITYKRAIKLMGLGTSTYRIWAKEEYFKCRHSLSKLCNNAYPGQLTIKEIRKMYNLLTNPKFLHWSVISVALYGRKKKIVGAHPNTWYKYNRFMKIKRTRYRKIKRRYKEGIRATAPNQKWHADITEIQLGNGLIYYLYLVIDNFSKYILSWRISNKICAKTRLESFEEAIKEAKRLGRKKKPLDLIVDGGTENNNKKVDAFLKAQKPDLRKLIALQDIDRSNSMIEATNKTVKYDYLYPKNIYDEAQLYKVTNWMIKDLNWIRPRASLKGQTSAEAQKGIPLNTKFISQLMKEARQERIKYNQNHTCTGCPFGCVR